MTPHTWVKEEIDGGALGAGDFWRCSVCGASGGPADWPIQVGDEEGPSWEPFIPGPALKLPADCLTARDMIRRYVEQRLVHLETLGPKGLSPKYPKLLREALRLTPEKTNIMPLVGLFYDIEAYQRRPELDALAKKLVELGFHLGDER